MHEFTVMRTHNPLRVEQAFKPGLLRDKAPSLPTEPVSSPAPSSGCSVCGEPSTPRHALSQQGEVRQELAKPGPRPALRTLLYQKLN